MTLADLLPACADARARAALLDGGATVLRADSPVHVTVSCLVLAEAGSGVRVGLVFHGKSGTWRQFGGHVDPADASLLAAVERECAEEGAGEVVVCPEPLSVRVFDVGSPECVQHVDVLYAARSAGAAAEGGVLAGADSSGRTASDDGVHSGAVRWCAVDDLPEAAAADLAGDLPRLIPAAEALLSAHRS